MKKGIYVLAALALFAFSRLPVDLTGTYGVCNTEGMVELRLNEDGTYHYLDRSNPNEPIDVEGKWEAVENRVRLVNDENLRFHDKWMISEDGSVAKSRKGMAFYRLVKKDRCN